MKVKLLASLACITLLTPAALGIGTLDVKKCTIIAGKSAGQDKINLSGFFNATADDLDAADEIVLTINSEHMLEPVTASFPIDTSTFKSGKYNSPRVAPGLNAPALSFKFGTQLGGFTFIGKNMDLTGLSCPVTVQIEIGGYVCQAQLEEDVVNGPKKPSPPQFLMNVHNWMMVDKALVKLNQAPGTDWIKVSGYFAVAGNYDTSNPMIVHLGAQTFTVGGNQFKRNGSSEHCSKGISQEGPSFIAKFDFAKCTFQIQISRAIMRESGLTSFGVDCFGRELPEQDIDVPAPSAPGYELERYRCYDRLGRRWTYSVNYVLQDSEGTYESGTESVSVSVANSKLLVNDRQCYVVSAQTADSTIASAWDQGYYGMSQYAWGNIGGMMEFEARMNALLVIPSLLSVGKKEKTFSPFTGDFELDLGPWFPDIAISDFKGNVSATTELLGFEPVTVPHGNFGVAAKVSAKQTLNGSMILQVDYFGEILRAKFNFQAVADHTWWGVEDVGIVKCQSSMLIKISGGGENIWVKMQETDVLTNYTP